jgi:hypothetical protein
VRGEGALGAEAGEDPEGVDALGDAAGEREVDLAELEHLRAVHDARFPAAHAAPMQ